MLIRKFAMALNLYVENPLPESAAVIKKSILLDTFGQQNSPVPGCHIRTEMSIRADK
jgi:hypothetical protein